jgi:hypothetical protein
VAGQFEWSLMLSRGTDDVEVIVVGAGAAGLGAGGLQRRGSL